MAISISNAFVTLFDGELKQAYQADTVLRNTVRLRSGVQGATHKFPKIGAGVATHRSISARKSSAGRWQHPHSRSFETFYWLRQDWVEN